MTLKLNGSSSGYTAIDAPAAAGSNTLTLPANNGSAGQVLKTDGNGNLAWVTPGIAIADRWRMSSNSTAGSEMVITAWERNDSSNAKAGFLGTGLGMVNGIFTFPSTGIWYISFHGIVRIGSAQDLQAVVELKVTEDGGSGWANGALCMYGEAADDTRTSISMDYLIDVDNVSNVKVKIETDSFSANTYLVGDTDDDHTTITFIRLGDT